MYRNTSLTMYGQRMLSVRETAEVVGCCLDTVRRQLRAGVMPSVRVGRSWRIPERQLAAYLQTPLSPHAAIASQNLSPSGTVDDDMDDDMLDVLLRIGTAHRMVLELTQSALENCNVDPDRRRALISALRSRLRAI